MADFNMSKLRLGNDGYYRDVNGNKIAQKGKPLSGAAWRYLASKYGKDYANRTSMNTRNGNIFQNGRWRFNDVKSSREGRTATWDEANSRINENAQAAGAKRTKYGYMQINPFNNKLTYLNQDSKNNSLASQKKNTANGEEKFQWSDYNPFTKEQWEGNWDSAIEGAGNAWSNVLKNNWVNAYNRAIDSFDSSKGGGFLEGIRDLQSNFSGTLSRTALDFLGGTVGLATQLVLPKKYEQVIGKYGNYLDLGKDLNSIRSAITPGEEILMPSDPRNKGLADKGFNWLDKFGYNEKRRQDINDEVNAVVAIFGTKGLKAGVTGLKSGVKSVATNGIGNTVKGNIGTISAHIPVAANIKQGISGAKSVYRGLAPKRFNGANGFRSRVKNIGQGGIEMAIATSPDAALWPYSQSGFIMNYNK